MSDNKTVTIKTILDKTGILKGIKEVQSWMKKNPLRLSPKVDMKSVEKEVQSKMDKINRQIAQSQNSVSQNKQGSDSGSLKTEAKNSVVSGSPPETSSSKQSGGLMTLVFPPATLLS